MFEFTLVADIKEKFYTVDKNDTKALGKMLFETRGCNGCHSLEKGEENLGPNLYSIGNRATEEYLKNSIQFPNRIIVEGYSKDIMPDYGKILDADQVDALVLYLSGFK